MKQEAEDFAKQLRNEDVRRKLKGGNITKQTNVLLRDFEEYMLQARRGGTNS